LPGLTLSLYLPPPFFSQALAGRSAPVYARWHFLAIDQLAALLATNLDFIGEDFNIGATFGAFI
jgi:hypothetical protein